MRFAVLDWDNTLRKGYTLFSWMDFLYDENVLDTRVKHRMGKVQQRYADGEITHDDYAEIACEVYAEEMKGISEAERENLVARYIKFDRHNIFPFTEEVFTVFEQYNIFPIIISGAPQYIVEQYAKQFHLHSVYAFSEEYADGICTGDVAFNYGMNKKKTVEMLCSKYDGRPIFGFGDSSSDIPLFDFSENAVCIVGEQNRYEFENKPFGSHVVYVESETIAKQMKKMMEKKLGSSCK